MSVKILSVDDSKTVRIIINKTFKQFDCQIVEAANGVEGLAAASKESPDLILLDITMPVMDGVEMLTRLKADPALKAIPVIMLTAEGGRDQVLKIAKLGIRDYIVKPFKEDMLVEKAGKVVELRAKEAQAQKNRTIFDPANILLVEDKPAIIQQIQEGLKHTPWKIQGATAPGEAIDLATKTPPDLVVLSLSLPDDGGFTLFRLLRQNQRTKTCPIFGLAVKTDAAVQQQAMQVGVTQVVTKPLDLDDLEQKITRALNLDTSPRYFSIADGSLYIKLPERVSPVVLGDLNGFLKTKIAEAVNSGIASAILDLEKPTGMDMGMIKLVMQAIGLFNDYRMPYGLVGNNQIALDCRNFEDTKGWVFHPNLAEAKQSLLAGSGRTATA